MHVRCAMEEAFLILSGGLYASLSNLSVADRARLNHRCALRIPDAVLRRAGAGGARGDGRGEGGTALFGVGLPFLAEEGDFREEGDYYIFNHMDRYFRTLSLRTGVGTKLTLTVDGREYRLYERYAPGTRIDLSIVPFYRALLGC